MKITALRLSNYRQFKSFRLDFTHPDSGVPLEKICFIGANGTGKSTILGVLAAALKTRARRESFEPLNNAPLEATSKIAVRFSDSHQACWLFVGPSKRGMRLEFLKDEASDVPAWKRIWSRQSTDENGAMHDFWAALCKYELAENPLALVDNAQDLAIYAPPDGSSLRAGTLPKVTLSDALVFSKSIPAFHICSYDEVKDFWKFLIYQIKKRESDQYEFMKRPDVRSMTVEHAEAEFNKQHPEILAGLAQLWDVILQRAGLYFDWEQAKIPVQLKENLQVFVKSRRTNTTLTYDLLSSGIRNFLFRLGHIYSLYFQRDIKRGFLLIDEPESSLFPDLLYDMINHYLSVTQNTQFFAATHSPIIAAQFHASERFVLSFNDEGYVQARRGVSPEGDDPNDLLMRDFGVRSLYGPTGVEMWRRFLELRRLIKAEDNPQTRQELLNEYAAIGNSYNFAPNEIPE